MNEPFDFITEPHIGSFDEFVNLLPNIVKKMPKFEYRDTKGNKLSVEYEKIQLYMPLKPDSDLAIDRRLKPRECRIRGISYKGKLSGRLKCTINDNQAFEISRSFGNLPVMVKSKKCHLHGKSGAEIAKEFGEDPREIGGYFIYNGNEKCVRLLVAPKRNYLFGIIRESNAKKGTNFTEYAVTARCVGEDETGTMMAFHYLIDGNICIRLYYMQKAFYIPVMLLLKSLMEVTDKEIFDAIIGEDLRFSATPRSLSGSEEEDFDRSEQEEDGSIDVSEVKNNGKIKGNKTQSKNLSPDRFHTMDVKRVQNLILSFNDMNLNSQQECINYIGARFKTIVNEREYSDQEAFTEVINRFIAIHLNKKEDKFNFLIVGIRKLYKLVNNKIPDNPDLQSTQELFTTCQIFATLLKEKMYEVLRMLKPVLSREKRFSVDVVTKAIKKANMDIGVKIEHLITTGNASIKMSSDFTEKAGNTTLAERINFFRYLSHFRSVNRGNFFAQLKTTTIRKLRPESWGFYCPVHTPDGSPCGIITHLAHTTKVISQPTFFDEKFLFDLGVIPLLRGCIKKQSFIEVFLDGRLMGYVDDFFSVDFVNKLRKHRADFKLTMEIVFVPHDSHEKSAYPGIFIFNSRGRLMRPVLNSSDQVEFIGIMEQVFLHIKSAQKNSIIKDYTNSLAEKNLEKQSCANSTDNIDKLLTENNFQININNTIKQSNTLCNSYKETESTDFLSIVANFTPFSDFNQSPRNMYQCQMAKQTMGTSHHNYKSRSENKSYRLIGPQSPLISTKIYKYYKMDNYPMGINAIVAVLSYTAYDMEDAMVINKSSIERGFFHGTVYKTERVDLQNKKERFIDMPNIGDKLSLNDKFYTYLKENGETKIITYQGSESGIVDTVRVFNSKDNEGLSMSVTLRIQRNPNIGDKFCSRHGQKGVCSMHWPLVDMPFTEDGIVPDIIINPHAFPSRMTIGMLIESMAGKACALSGKTYDGSPFQFNITSDNNKKNIKSTNHKQTTSKSTYKTEKKINRNKKEKSDTNEDTSVQDISAVDYFGQELIKYGYNYHGNETMYSGVTGDEFKADIFIGVVYYQRLRHMVNDKFQVRTTGGLQKLTRQPTGGRKRKGGIRLGEMERDALIGHGVSAILKERLLYASDHTIFDYCCGCKSILFVSNEKCICGSTIIKQISLPYVFKYMCTELLSMNIKIMLDV
ncbi:hypothetical protein EDEG_03169 [Edhazardia aedis USNM 41457]|uniref:DNA-directed RNA polymerase subunit beta n=1 Tax=Edhazardia aedis (strain USNM 41457) TaxID=1003232 RepID=J9DIF3_EDHAE|nr:hypothetical protein EDEG_03169 [Edhazardia aedis USNM 41457]|eukprot:EJW02400.1 hypothetical protein EDEG_03169 [Edhazardia aedis USNM 41457]